MNNGMSGERLLNIFSREFSVLDSTESPHDFLLEFSIRLYHRPKNSAA